MNPTIPVPNLSSWSPSKKHKKPKTSDTAKEKSRRKMAKKSRRINRGR